MEECFTGGCFRWEGFIFKWGVHPMGRDIGFDGEVSKKILGWGARQTFRVLGKHKAKKIKVEYLR